MVQNIPQIIGIGRAFMDVLADIDDAFLEKHELTKGQGISITAEKLETIIDDIKNPIYMPGGAVANSIAGLQALRLPSGLYGVSANDISGQKFREVFQQKNIPLYGDVHSQGQSGTCICLNTPDGERTFAFHLGVCELLSPGELPSEVLNNVDYIFVQALMLLTPEAEAETMHMADAIQKTKTKIAVSLHDMQDTERKFEDFMSRAHLFIGNVKEVGHILGSTDLQQLHEKAKKQDLIICITRGAEGSVLISKEEILEVPCIKPDEFVDTVGAGDLFAAGLLYGLHYGWPLSKSADLAARCAACIIEQQGGHPDEKISQKISALI